MSWARHSSPMRSIQACLMVVDVRLLERGVVEQDLDAVGAGFLEAANAPDVEQVGQAAGGCGVVAGLLVGEQEALAVAVLGGGEAVLGVEQDGGGVAGEDLGDEGLEVFEIVGVGGGAALLGEGLLEGAALVHGGGGDDAACVGDGFESGEFSWGQLRHFVVLLCKLCGLSVRGHFTQCWQLESGFSRFSALASPG